MKKKLALALSLVLCLCTLCACSTEKADPVVLFDDAIYSTLGTWFWLQEGTDPSSSSYQDEVFQPDPSGGNYLRVQFHNLTDQWVTVILLRLEADGTLSPSDDYGSVILLRVDGGAQASETYYAEDAASGSYILRVEATQEGGPIAGALTLTQSVDDPDR